jgi:hypothetical protein
MISVEPLFLRDNFTATVAMPPLEIAPAMISPMVERQNGHIVVLLSGGEAEPLSHLYRCDGQGRAISTGLQKN